MSTFTTGKVTVCYVDSYQEGLKRINTSYSSGSTYGKILRNLWLVCWHHQGPFIQFEDGGSSVILVKSQKATVDTVDPDTLTDLLSVDSSL
jgi:hypothetical protein